MLDWPRAAPQERHRVNALEFVVSDTHAVLGIANAALQELAGVKLDGQLYVVFTIRDGQIAYIHITRLSSKLRSPKSPHLAELIGLDSVKPPLPGNTFELLVSTVVKLDAGACHQVFHGARDENLARLGKRGDSRPDVNGDSGQLPGLSLTFTGVQAGPNDDTLVAR